MSDITVHIDEKLDETSLGVLQYDLSHLRGVREVNADGNRPHLMVVHYDHRELDSRRILSEFQGHGYHAELIGF
jgi:hypothetical protein